MNEDNGRPGPRPRDNNKARMRLRNLYILAVPPRERECAYLLAHGYTRDEISAVLLIDRKTVWKYIQRIKKKLVISTDDELADFIFFLEGRTRIRPTQL